MNKKRLDFYTIEDINFYKNLRKICFLVDIYKNNIEKKSLIEGNKKTCKLQ